MFSKIKQWWKEFKLVLLSLMEFLKDVAVSIELKSKETKETHKKIEIHNLFLIAIILVMAGIVTLVLWRNP